MEFLRKQLGMVLNVDGFNRLNCLIWESNEAVVVVPVVHVRTSTPTALFCLSYLKDDRLFWTV